jgi:opacity protein-like surface antigen
MKKIVLIATLFTSFWAIQPANAQPRRNQIGPSITFSNGSSAFGVNGKFNLTDNIFEVKNSLSLRPFARFPSGSAEIGAAVTYDFDFARYSQVIPYLGLGVGALNDRNSNSLTAFYAQGGIDLGINPDWSLGANLNVPLNNRLDTSVTLGANYRF